MLASGSTRREGLAELFHFGGIGIVNVLRDRPHPSRALALAVDVAVVDATAAKESNALFDDRKALPSGA